MFKVLGRLHRTRFCPLLELENPSGRSQRQRRSELSARPVLDGFSSTMRLDLRRSLQVRWDSSPRTAARYGGRRGRSCPVGSWRRAATSCRNRPRGSTGAPRPGPHLCLCWKYRHFRVSQQTHVAIGPSHPAGKALLLHLACLLHTCADVRAWFAESLVGQLALRLAQDVVIVHARHFDVDVDPTGRLRTAVEQGAGDALVTAGNPRSKAERGGSG